MIRLNLLFLMVILLATGVISRGKTISALVDHVSEFHSHHHDASKGHHEHQHSDESDESEPHDARDHQFEISLHSIALSKEEDSPDFFTYLQSYKFSISYVEESDLPAGRSISIFRPPIA